MRRSGAVIRQLVDVRTRSSSSSTRSAWEVETSRSWRRRATVRLQPGDLGVGRGAILGELVVRGGELLPVGDQRVVVGGQHGDALVQLGHPVASIDQLTVEVEDVGHPRRVRPEVDGREGGVGAGQLAELVGHGRELGRHGVLEVSGPPGQFGSDDRAGLGHVPPAGIERADPLGVEPLGQRLGRGRREVQELSGLHHVDRSAGQGGQGGAVVGGPEGQTVTAGRGVPTVERVGHLGGRAPHEHGRHRIVEQPEPVGEEQAEPGVLPHLGPGGAVDPVQGGEGLVVESGDHRVVLPPVGQGRWPVPQSVDGAEQPIVQLDQRVALVVDRIVGVPLDQVRRRGEGQAEPGQHPGEGRRVAPVHAHHEHPGPGGPAGRRRHRIGRPLPGGRSSGTRGGRSVTVDQRVRSTAASPWPPPPHRLTAAVPPPRRLSSSSDGQGQAGARHADRVAEGDGPAVDVDDVTADAEVVGRGQADGGEGLVDLEQVDVAHAEPGLGQGHRRWRGTAGGGATGRGRPPGRS